MSPHVVPILATPPNAAGASSAGSEPSSSASTIAEIPASGGGVPYFDEALGAAMGVQMGAPFDLLLGRKTYDIFAAYWPKQTEPFARPINEATKYVASRTVSKLEWGLAVLLKGEVAAQLRKLKQSNGPDLQVHGSGNLIQTLLKHDLVDELWLKVFPLTLGKGKRLFGEGAIPAAFTLTESKTTPAGVVIASYTRADEVKTGSF
jgi:dihydrofolate reductase